MLSETRDAFLQDVRGHLQRGRCGLVTVLCAGLETLEEACGFGESQELIEDLRASLDGEDVVVGLLAPGEVAVLCLQASSVSVVEGVGSKAVTAGSHRSLEPGVGVALSVTGETVEELVGRTRRAARKSTADAAGTYVVSTERPGAGTARTALVTELERGVSRNEVIAHYQPVVDVASGQVRGFESLVRWRHPERGILTPPYFLPLVTDSSLAQAITQRVLDDACENLGRWRLQRPETIVSVNVSGRDWANPRLSRIVADTLGRWEAEASGLVVEVPMSVLVVDAERSRRAIKDLSAIGVSVVVDDFGTGPTSLVDLRSLPVRGVKVDRTFVEEAASRDTRTARRGGSILKAALTLAAGMDLHVIAEGVETPEQELVVKESSCPFAQGYHYSRALPPDEAQKYLDRH